MITVADDKPLKEEDNAERLAAGLRKRGLVAEDHSIDAEDCPIGVSIQEHAIKRGAQLLVMGGFGHSRMRDFVLGGATKDVLNDLRIPMPRYFSDIHDGEDLTVDQTGLQRESEE